MNEIAAPNSDGCHSALARLRQQMRAPQCRLLLRAEEAEMADALQADLVGVLGIEGAVGREGEIEGRRNTPHAIAGGPEMREIGRGAPRVRPSFEARPKTGEHVRMRLIVLLGLTRWPLVAIGARLSPSATVWALVGWVLLRLDRRLCRHKDADPASL